MTSQNSDEQQELMVDLARNLDGDIKIFLKNRSYAGYVPNNEDKEEIDYYLNSIHQYINDLSEYNSSNINDPNRIPVEGVLSNLVDNKAKLVKLSNNSTQGGRRKFMRRTKKRHSKRSRKNKRKSRRYRK